MQKGLRQNLIKKVKEGRMKKQHRQEYNKILEEGMRNGTLKNVVLAFSDAEIARLSKINEQLSSS
jgi:hypothetical protein